MTVGRGVTCLDKFEIIFLKILTLVVAVVSLLWTKTIYKQGVYDTSLTSLATL